MQARDNVKHNRSTPARPRARTGVAGSAAYHAAVADAAARASGFARFRALELREAAAVAWNRWSGAARPSRVLGRLRSFAVARVPPTRWRAPAGERRSYSN